MALNRAFYSFSVFVFAVFAVIHLVQGINYFLIGQQIYAVSIFFSWYIFQSCLIFLASFVYINYFYFKKYIAAFWAAVANAIAGLVQFVVFVGLLTGKREWVSLYIPIELLLLVTITLLGLILIFSNAGKRPWLKFVGIYYVIIGVILMAVGIWYLNSVTTVVLSVLEQTTKWAFLLGFIGPVMMMMNFLEEKKELRSEDSVPSRKSEDLIVIIQPIVMLAALFFSLKVTGESISKYSWEKNLARKSKEWEKVWAARTFVDTKGDTLKYQLIHPENFDSTKTYPMVVCLPYGGGIEGSPAAQYLLEQSHRKQYPSFLFVPFCPNGSGWGGIPNYPTMDTLVFESIESVEKEFKEIDSNRVYITGVSRGGYGSWHFISLRPDLFAAAMPVCGGGDPKLATNMVDVAVWAFHGEDDPNVPVSGSRDVIAAIKKSGGNPKYTEFSGAGHNIWHYVTTTPGVFEWMFEQEKSVSSEQPAASNDEL